MVKLRLAILRVVLACYYFRNRKLVGILALVVALLAAWAVVLIRLRSLSISEVTNRLANLPLGCPLDLCKELAFPGFM